MSSLRLRVPRSQACFPFFQLNPPQLPCGSSTGAFPALPQGPGPACGPFWEGPLCNLPFLSSCYWSLLRGEKVGEEEDGLGTRGEQTGSAWCMTEKPGCYQGTTGTPYAERQSGEGPAVLLRRAWPHSPGLG